MDVLAAGGSALDAAQLAVRVLEDDPLFNAGTGSVLNEDGEVETDASVMEGATLRAGAVAAVRGVKNPVVLARAVMERSGHLLLAAEGALRFAREIGMALVDPGTMITEAALARFRDVARERGTGTVGACAIDAAGHVAAATSTGGTSHKRAGRVGDTPIIGAGTYADDAAGAVSCTGHGEDIVRVVLARACCERMARGMSAQQAADASIAELGRRVQGSGGLIAVDRQGRVGFAYNTQAMSRAWIGSGGPLVTGA